LTHTSDAGLVVESVVTRYGPVTAVDGVTLEVRPGEIVAVLGPNGAGKSTLLRTISGLVRPVSGAIWVDRCELTGKPPHITTRAGVAHVPEGRRVVAPLSVEDNLRLAANAAHRSSKKDVSSALADVYQLFPRLGERKKQASGLLSGGEQQMLAIGRAVVARPSVLLLDEPSMGLAPIVIEEIFELLRNRIGPLAEVAILLAEQSAAVALDVADRAAVLTLGRVAMQGSADELRRDARLLAAYLGSGSNITDAAESSAAAGRT
jgi:branched-chain amino acid transport system ATP-binding protein